MANGARRWRKDITPDREISEDEWIAASQACCGTEPDDVPDGAHKTEDGDRPPPSPDPHAPPTDR